MKSRWMDGNSDMKSTWMKDRNSYIKSRRMEGWKQ